LGDVEHYVEPFAGSLAVLLARPHEPRVETVNDLDRWIVNFWRALQHDPEQVAQYADNPVNEADLLARHIWLVNSGAERIARLEGDPDYYDAKVAGWWVWGICCWIGSGWCSGQGPWVSIDGKCVDRRTLATADAGQGVNRKLVHLGDAGRGVNRKPVHLCRYGRGVNCKRVYNGDGLVAYMQALATRLRRVRVCCGDWSRVVTMGALAAGDPVGIFLDPPYDRGLRDPGCYGQDADGLSAQVREWAVANGGNPRYRIILAGYEGEHKMPAAWRVIKWTAGRPYGRTNGADNGNRFLERLWLSPLCLRPAQPRMEALL